MSIPETGKQRQKECLIVDVNFVETLANRNWKLPKPLLRVAVSVLCSSMAFAQTFTSTTNLKTGRNGHRAIVLKNGTVLIAGGYDFNENALASCELYDSLTGAFSFTGSLNVARRNFGITLLDDGTVLVSGGVTTRTLTHCRVPKFMIQLPECSR
jgi:hypothetical protein